MNGAAVPILICGVMHRSGTNYLTDLIGAHPAVGRCPPIAEDFLLHHAEHLDAYATTLHHTWSRHERQWGRIGPEVRDEVLGALGESMLGVLACRCPPGRRLLTKSPSVRNLHLLPRLFPRVRPLILVRDGRAVVESWVRSRLGEVTNDPYRTLAHRWTGAARAIVDYDHLHRANGERYLIVRYEDVFTDPEPWLRRIFELVGLDADAYDFDAAHSVPVRGSSTFRGEPGAELHWRPVERTEAFRPLERFADWPEERLAMFDAIAGDYLRMFGYGGEAAAGG